MPLAPGTTAPEFALKDQNNQVVRLSDFRGRKAVALMYFPFAFTGVCTGELSGVRDRLDEFLTFDTEVLALSCDSVYSLRSFAETEGLNFPLLSDFWPHGATAQAYGAFNEKAGMALRPATAVEPYLDMLSELDMLLIMTVEPGFGGQAFLDVTLPKIARAAKAIEGANLPVTVQVDGGITEETILRAAEAGATCFVAGSSVYGVDEALGGATSR